MIKYLHLLNFPNISSSNTYLFVKLGLYFVRIFLLIFSLTAPLFIFVPMKLLAQQYSIILSDTQIDKLATLIWKNEGAGKKEYLTVWNKNEAFPSLGIGHFIWYPNQEKGPYVEQFPELLKYLVDNNVSVPEWLLTAKNAPWHNREDFYNHFDDTQLAELRELLASTVSLQAAFIIKRLEKGIPDILNASSDQEKQIINKRVMEMSETPEGTFALLDYINFKGEGIAQKERYQGKGWGLKQVLLNMPDQNTDLLLNFAISADQMLTRRVENAPRDESAWLKGWRARVYQYPALTIN
ncbi:hypothetical protein [Psychromonas sp. B3M02]|uniref:hypothetical protein n=1 Tax=Psychromonas sp. B3M02 TaxID=2267226 RepID=UPI00215D6EC8|nr:hypothetical protein [Psychromonas sp. B3M02]